MLPLFPDSEGEFALAFAVPGDQPAGRHPLTVEVRSHTTGAVHHADVDLDVSARPGMRVVREPRMARARRTGRFVLAVVNEGNVPLDVSLAGVANDAGTTVTLSSTLVRVAPGTTRSVMAKVRGAADVHRLRGGPDRRCRPGRPGGPRRRARGDGPRGRGGSGARRVDLPPAAPASAGEPGGC
ncbi:hypothetical protein [Nocardioides sp. TF02-7]|uniref:COG1470 family protein n=1 Tax=Nocardioides sp. TF02-7 TaxID=2917724 RepID=UPI001F0571CB|nr:hypothetical protein [Nocardioides sp. TF02-7]UMG91029.1 hypothetical protein MF408_12415 [Nocardioides sp. TF02-7]